MSYYRLRALRAKESAHSMDCEEGRLHLLRLACLYEQNARLEEGARRQHLRRPSER